MSEERLSFQAEVSRLLDIVAHSLYSEKEVFLRELISNASDACDRLRYAALTQPELAADDPTLRIRLRVDTETKTLTVIDNGIGMNRLDLVDNLGTIARSGTSHFLNQVTGDDRKDLSLIGQFGVGFYSAFMVAERVEVLTRRAGESEGWRWTSDGKGTFTIAEATDVPRGTQVILYLRDTDHEYLEEQRLHHVVQTYSDHIALPIVLEGGEESKTLNRASALWTRSKNEITAEQYKEFYHHVGHAFDEPWLNIHWKAEGKIEYTGLLFVPTTKPFDLFDPRRAHRVKLYVKRVFITEGTEGLVPPYLRFLRGVIDSEDLPLNVSREMLQHNPMVAKIRAGLTRRVLNELARKAGDTEAVAEYHKFWEVFGAVIKEGMYEDPDHRDDMFKLLRFRSTESQELLSLDDYIGRMKEKQEAIYYITGDDIEQLRRSPQLEGFCARGVEVLLLTDPVDEFWVPGVGSYKDKPFKSVTRSRTDLEEIAPLPAPAETDAPKPAAAESALASLVALFKLTLADHVKDVRTSQRLTESAVCLVSDEGDIDIHLERLLKQHHQLHGTAARRILEINPNHGLIIRLATLAEQGGANVTLEEMAWLLLDQARIVEGESIPDAVAFTRRLVAMLEKGLG